MPSTRANLWPDALTFKLEVITQGKKEKVNKPNIRGSFVLGLDLATHSGYSVWDLGHRNLREVGVIDCSIDTKSSKGGAEPPGKRFHLLKEAVTDIFWEYESISAIYHERSVGGPTAGGAPALVSVGMTAIIQQFAFELSIPCVSISTGTLKKHATGNGGHDTKKQHMIAAALLMLPTRGIAGKIPRREPTKSKPWTYDDDAIDAIWAGHYGLHELTESQYRCPYEFKLAEQPNRVHYAQRGTSTTLPIDV